MAHRSTWKFLAASAFLFLGLNSIALAGGHRRDVIVVAPAPVVAAAPVVALAPAQVVVARPVTTAYVVQAAPVYETRAVYLEPAPTVLRLAPARAYAPTSAIYAAPAASVYAAPAYAVPAQEVIVLPRAYYRRGY